MIRYLLILTFLMAATASESKIVSSLVATRSRIKWDLTQTAGIALATDVQLINGQPCWASQSINARESTARLEVIASMTNP